MIQTKGGGTFTVPAAESPAQIRAFAVSVANQDYADYHSNFLVPSTTLMVQVGLWIALEATIGFMVGLGLSSLMGQRTVAVILLIVLELILTPIFSRHVISHLLNVQRRSSASPWPTLSRGSPDALQRRWWGRRCRRQPADPRVHPGVVAGDRGLDCVWTAIGAWRMKTRDA